MRSCVRAAGFCAVVLNGGGVKTFGWPSIRISEICRWSLAVSSSSGSTRVGSLGSGTFDREPMTSASGAALFVRHVPVSDTGDDELDDPQAVSAAAIRTPVTAAPKRR